MPEITEGGVKISLYSRSHPPPVCMRGPQLQTPMFKNIMTNETKNFSCATTSGTLFFLRAALSFADLGIAIEFDNLNASVDSKTLLNVDVGR